MLHIALQAGELLLRKMREKRFNPNYQLDKESADAKFNPNY